MSEQEQGNVQEKQMDSNPETSNESNNDFVPKRAYKEVSEDMHKYKTQLRETQAKLNELNAKMEAERNRQLEDENRYKELYEGLKGKYEKETSQFKDIHKKNAVINKVGGLKRSEYAKFIDTSNIHMDENGMIDKESIDREVMRLQQEFPELINSNNFNNVNNNAPKSDQSRLTLEEWKKLPYAERVKNPDLGQNPGWE